MAKLNEKAKRTLRDAAIVAGGLAGAFAFFMFVLSVVLGLPFIELCFVLIAMGPS